jgi:hypothetical protein
MRTAAQSTVVRSCSVARAMPATIAGSLRNSSEAGSNTPRDMWMTPVVSSTLTNCSPDFWKSRSVRPRQGRMSAFSPVIKCARLSLVEICTVSLQRCNASDVAQACSSDRTGLASSIVPTMRKCLLSGRIRRFSAVRGSRKSCSTKKPFGRSGIVPSWNPRSIFTGMALESSNFSFTCQRRSKFLSVVGKDASA